MANKKPSEVRKISISLNEENFEALTDLEYIAKNRGLEINRSKIINEALESYFKCSYDYLGKYRDKGIDGNFIRSEIPLHKTVVELLEDLKEKYGLQKLALWLNYVIYSRVVNSSIPLIIGNIAEIEEFERQMQKLADRIQKK